MTSETKVILEGDTKRSWTVPPLSSAGIEPSDSIEPLNYPDELGNICVTRFRCQKGYIKTHAVRKKKDLIRKTIIITFRDPKRVSMLKRLLLLKKL